MMKHTRIRCRALSAVLAAVMVLSLVVPASAVGTDTAVHTGNGLTWQQMDNDAFRAPLPINEDAVAEDLPAAYADTDEVRVSIILTDASTIEKGFSTDEITVSTQARRYRQKLEATQDRMADTISAQVLDGQPLDVVWSLTLAANIISANVEYGQIEEIEKLPGVKEVVIENRYSPCVVDQDETADPNMSTSGAMIGSSIAWADGYTGAGARIAVIDTGADVDHPSLDPDAFTYAVKDSGAKLMTEADIAAVLGQLNVLNKMEDVTASDLYVNAKIPFGFNYVDSSLDITHDNDAQGDHGSHVTGIAAGNRYIKNEDGTYSDALDTVLTQGVAPDAQIMTMKVFGAAGGAYDSDYMAAIEDAIVLGADAVNLSLGSANAGYSRSATEAYQAIMDAITESGTVVAMAAGNAGHWFEQTTYGHPYADGSSWSTAGSPGSYTNSLDVASADNVGATFNYLEVGGKKLPYTESANYSNVSMVTIAGEHEFVYVDSIGTAEEFAAVKDVLAGKIAICNRGTTAFYEKGNAAIENGAIAAIIANNEAGVLNMDLSDYAHTEPCVSVSQADGAAIKAAATAVKDESGKVLYYTGKMVVSDSPTTVADTGDGYAMSSFSSWGVPGSLEMKPEITAPGGSIYSLKNGGGYQNMSGTSMASPQIAGMAALAAQYIKAAGLADKSGLTVRQLAQSLLMSTAVPMVDQDSESYYSILQQGAGLANIGAAVTAGSYLTMDADATASYADGKVKAELGDDPDRTGSYRFGFTIHNLEDKATSFNLSADFFTQGILVGEATDGTTVNFEDTATVPLASNVTWTVDGQEMTFDAPAALALCDFDGNGTVNADDGQALLDYVTGVRTSISHMDRADLDVDGDIDTYDVYLFFKRLTTGTVEVPAGGSVHVTVNAQVLGLDQYDEASNGTGTYVEGYVFAEEPSSSEGETGTTHSIPVLGYYGSWTDSSMFDVGSTIAYRYGLENRPPYLYAATNQAVGFQDMTVKYTGTSEHLSFGGNPYVEDGFYDPDRYAINPDTSTLSDAYFTLIRNAATARVTIEGSDGKEYLNTESNYPIAAAYYHINNRFWNQLQSSVSINAAPKAEEGTVLTVKITMAPEYYVDYSGKTAVTDWNALGDGASQVYTVNIDKTAPVLDEVFFKEDTATGVRHLNVTATDNRYLAAAVLYNYDSGKVISKVAGSPEGAAKGDTVTMDLGEIGSDTPHLVLRVYDYANNCSTYKINQNRDELEGPVSVTLDKTSAHLYKGGTLALNAEVAPFGIHPDTVLWSSSNEAAATVDQNGIVTGIGDGEAVITAAYAADPTKSASCTVTVETVKATLYGALQDANANATFYTWDMENDTTWKGGATLQAGSLISSALDHRTGNVVVMDSTTHDFHVVDPSTGKDLATYPGIDGHGGFNVPVYDMECSQVFSTGDKPTMFSLYSFMIFTPAPLGELQSKGFVMFMELFQNTGADKFTAVTSCGATKMDLDGDGTEETDAELFLVLDNKGYVWTMKLYQQDGEYKLDYKASRTNLSSYKLYFMGDDNGNPDCSMVAATENGKLVLYLSYLAKTTSQIYRMVYDSTSNSWNADFIADFGENVFPATVYALDSHTKADLSTVAKADLPVCDHTVGTQPITEETYRMNAQTASAGSLSAVGGTPAEGGKVTLLSAEAAPAASSNVTVSDDEQTVTVNLVAGGEDATTNALMTVDYDSSLLTLTDVTMTADYTSHHDEDGKVTLGYVSLGGVPAGTTVATLTFRADPAKVDAGTVVTVNQTERNDKKVDVTETLEADLHTETEIVGKKDPTCTDKGYTGDVVCAKCGKLLTKGEELPATGHDFKDGVCTKCGLKASNAKTGDSSFPAAAAAVLTVSLLGAAVLVLRKKRFF